MRLLNIFLMSLFLSVTAAAQSIGVSGTVRSANGDVLPGAGVMVKGTSSGTISDANGRYSITAGSNAVLVFSLLGMKDEEIKVEGRSLIDVVLEEDSKFLDEVVVVGYGSMRRQLMTSAQGNMKVDDNNMKMTALSPSQLLEGRIAGVNMQLSSGNLGTRERVSIRGVSSLNAGNEPLYVVDGIVISNLNGNLYDFGESMSTLATLNLSDIESVEVLKDAASAAIYGSKASNGVILITTKSGKAGRKDVKVNFNMGFSNFANRNKVKYANSALYIEQYNEGAANYNKQYGLKVGDSNYITPICNPHPTIPDTDWLGLILQTGRNIGADASFSGGNKDTQYYVGVAYLDQQGIVRTNAMKKFTINAKLDQKMTKWLKVGANLTGSFIRNNQVPGSSSGATILARAVQKRPFDLPYKPNGEYYVGGTDELAYHNPVQILNEENTKTENYRFLGNVYGQINFFKDLYFRTSLNADVLYTYDYIYYNENHPYGLGTGRIIDNTRLARNINWDNILNYDHSFGDFDLSAMLGHSFQTYNCRTALIDGNGFPSPSFDVVGIAATIANTNAVNIGNAMESYFGRVTASYKDKYMLTATLRTDGSSKFVRAVRWGWFPSVSLGWNMSKENFWTNKKFDLKLRASYGKTGNQDGIGNYDAQSLISGGYNYNQGVGIAVGSFGNDQLTWEKADQFNVGLDFTYLQGKVQVIFDAYQKDTHGLLYSKPTTATSGATSLISNIGSIRNRGLELTVNTHFNLGKVRWDSSLNLAHNKNVVTELVGDEKLIAVGNNCALKVGCEVGAFYLFQMDGIYQYDGEIPLAQYNDGVRAGDVKWHDADGNGIINDSDRQIYSSAQPKLSGGWSNTFSLGNFSLDIFANFMLGNKTYAAWKQTSLARVGYLAGCLEEYVVNRWTGPGSTNVYARSINGSARSGYNTKNSDRFLEDGSFLRIRTVTLSYNIPEKLLKKVKLSGVRLYCQADNLFLFTGYSGYDPECSKYNSALYYGIDEFSMPAPRTFSFGVNMKF